MVIFFSHVTSELNAFAWERGRMISYRGFNYGYSGMSYTGCFRGGSVPGRVPYSVDYVLDLLLKHNQVWSLTIFWFLFLSWNAHRERVFVLFSCVRAVF